MVAPPTQRRKHVGELRRLARRFGIAPTARDDVGKAKVLAMVAALKTASLDDEATQQVLSLEQAYLHAFPGVSDQSRPVKLAPFRLRGTSFLLTWNWSFATRQLPYGTAAQPLREVRMEIREAQRFKYVGELRLLARRFGVAIRTGGLHERAIMHISIRLREEKTLRRYTKA